MFITFEGIDGCGKTTQLKLLAQYLSDREHEVLTTFQPGASEFGKNLREILLHYKGEVSPRAEQFLFLADRAQHVDMVIKPALNEGKIVLCDRYVDSSVAYQGYGRELNLDQIRYVNNFATNGLAPELTFFFDVDIETSQKRVGTQKDRLEQAGYEFFERVRAGYKQIAAQEPGRVKVLDAARSIEQIQEEIISIISSSLN
jgi:dTMP kinase